ncbi:MAG: hypothetical protein ACK5TH_22045 [Prosthecobacter sp.]|jgi:hypothetical protein
MNTNEPQPIPLEEAQRIWTLQKQNKPLSPEDQKLLEQAWEWQMWVSHGIQLPSGKKESPRSLKASSVLQKAAAVL